MLSKTLATLVLLVSSLANAWSEHNLITRAALENVPALKNKTVRITTLGDFLREMNVSDLKAFEEAIQINKNYRFNFKAGEKLFSDISAIDVLATYSDEPDWGMDQDLFDEGQYPALWKDEYSMMGGRNGEHSQGFRHMYWQPFSFKNGAATFKLPISRLMKHMGEAPQRAAMFMKLAEHAQVTGHPYWALRFTANALHYIEDVTQPFHSVQVPHLSWALKPFKDKQGTGAKDFVAQITNIIIYYHHAFEDYMGRVMKEENLSPSDRKFLWATLNSELTTVPAGPIDVKWLVEELSAVASQQAPQMAKICVGFFPQPTVPYRELEYKSQMNDEWWQKTINQGDTPVRREYLGLVGTIFSPLSVAIRAIVLKQLEIPSGRK